jgi:hypothetical protein
MQKLSSSAFTGHLALLLFLVSLGVSAQDRSGDWLVDGKSRPAQVVEVSANEIQLTNGLV